MTKQDFSEWLQAEMDGRGLRQADLARISGIHTGHLSKVLNRERGPGVDFCKRVAKAFGMREIVVLEKAGLAKNEEQQKFSPLVELMAKMLQDMSDDHQEDFRALIQAAWEREQIKKPIPGRPKS